MSVTPLNLQFDHKKLIIDYEEICKIVSPKFGQICITHSGSKSTPKQQFEDGVGSLLDYDQDMQSESHFTVLNELLRGTYTERLYQSIVDFAKPKMIGRVRYMLIEPKTCYTLHRDLDEHRFHIPLITNSKCFFISENIPGHLAAPEYMPVEGQVYLFNTEMFHTAVNASKEPRLHIVFSTYDV